MRAEERSGTDTLAAMPATGRDAAADTFDRNGDAWAAWQQTPWAQLRYRLVARTLRTALDRLPGPCRVLDAGGGDGADSIPLAAAGHRVTILDQSAPLLARAAEAADAAGATERVETVQADLGRLAASGRLGPGVGSGFDLVLCHNVLHYLADPSGAIRLLVGAARPGGVLSLLSPNPAMDVLAAAVRDTDPEAALDLLDAPTIRSQTFDHEMQRLEPEAVEAELVGAGCRVTHRFGLRSVMDLIADNELKHDPEFAASLERLELELSTREPYRRIAKFWQLLAVREPPGDF